MAVEVRFILFSMKEITQALVAHLRKAGKPLPVGSVRRVSLAAAPTLNVAIDLVPDKEGEAVRMTVKEGELIAMIIAFCIDQHIPLPRDGAKSLRLVENEFYLVVALGASEEHMKIFK